MGRYFKETAHLKTDKEKYEKNHDRIFGVKDVITKPVISKTCFRCKEKTIEYKMLHGMFYYCNNCLEKL